MRAKLTRPFEWKVWHLFLMAVVASGVVLLIFGAAVIGSLYLRGQSRKETQRNRAAIAVNRRSIDNQARIQRLERPPTQAELTAAALRALAAIRACAKSPSCRRQNPGVQRVARNLGTGRIPTPRRRRTSSPGGGSSGTGGGTDTPSRPNAPSVPSQTGSSPQPTTRPRAPTPAPSPPPANPPASAPQTPPKPQPTPAPTPAPTPSVPAQTTPPVGPVPPVTTPSVPLPIPIPQLPLCHPPLVVVNCKDLAGRFVSASAIVDPASNSGRGSADDPLCDRLKLPCDADGSPVFPPGLIRLP